MTYKDGIRRYKQAECVYCHQVKFISAHGLCRACYSRERLNGTVVPKPKRGRSLCSEMGCSKPVVSYGKCDTHRDRTERKRKLAQTERAIKQREDRKKNFLRNKAKDLRKDFGISLERYTELFEKQNGVCAICGQADKRVHRATGLPMSLSVDHDHTTGKIRGLLCSPCNHGIGNFREDINLLHRAEEYLNFYSQLM